MERVLLVGVWLGREQEKKSGEVMCFLFKIGRELGVKAQFVELTKMSMCISFVYISSNMICAFFYFL